jgi:hypothetical protein
MLETVRAVTGAPGAIAAVVVTELGAHHLWEALLHNDRSVYLEWLLLSEPRTVVTQVPLHRPTATTRDARRRTVTLRPKG